jgi:hypothetical protein
MTPVSSHTIEDAALYSLAEAAALIHPTITPEHLRRAIYAKKLVPTRIGRVTLIEGAELKRFRRASQCRDQIPDLAFDSTDRTTGTVPPPVKASPAISGTSSGRRRERNESAARAAIDRIADQLIRRSPSSSPNDSPHGKGLVVPMISES